MNQDSIKGDAGEKKITWNPIKELYETCSGSEADTNFRKGQQEGTKQGKQVCSKMTVAQTLQFAE